VNGKSITVVNPDEVGKRAARDESKLDVAITDPIAYVKSLVEKIADESGVISNVRVSPEGKMGVMFYATVDVKKLEAIARTGRAGQ